MWRSYVGEDPLNLTGKPHSGGKVEQSDLYDTRSLYQVRYFSIFLELHHGMRTWDPKGIGN